MGRQKKFLAKLGKKEKYRVLRAMRDVRLNKLTHYDVKKLTGHKHVYRVRQGRYRILFEKLDGQNRIIDIRLRDDHTYDL